MKLESDFQRQVIRELTDLFPKCIILKNDEQYQQGIPDLSVLWYDKWAFLETKRSLHETYEPNQEWFIARADELSFGAMICPENKEEVFHALQLAFRA